MLIMETIQKIKADEISDSRGNPTIRVEIFTEKYSARAEVPSGASTGKYEAVELRDGDKNRFEGRGVLRAIQNIEKIIFPEIKGKDPLDQKGIDEKMEEIDGTLNFSKIGANAAIGVSMAAARLGSVISNKPLYEYLGGLYGLKPDKKLPRLQFNLINGGKHAETKLPFQEYHVVPITEDIGEAIEIIYRFQSGLRKKLRANIGDEGGFVPDLSGYEEPLAIFSEIAVGLGLKDKVRFSLDVAASSFFKGGLYDLGDKKVDSREMLRIYKDICGKYPILSIEDPFDEEDFDMFAEIKKEIPDIIVVGDDLTVTNASRIKEAINRESIGGVIIKPNQIGTLSKTFDAVKMAYDHGVDCIVSHRSGETNDDFIADIALGINAFGVKFGALQRGERVAKYNRLKEIFNN